MLRANSIVIKLRGTKKNAKMRTYSIFIYALHKECLHFKFHVTINVTLLSEQPTASSIIPQISVSERCLSQIVNVFCLKYLSGYVVP